MCSSLMYENRYAFSDKFRAKINVFHISFIITLSEKKRSDCKCQQRRFDTLKYSFMCHCVFVCDVTHSQTIATFMTQCLAKHIYI